MEKHGTLLVLSIVALAAVGGWLLLRGPGSAPVVPATPVVAEGTEPAPALDKISVEPRPVAASARAARTEVEVAPPGLADDPEIVAAQSRLVGRVLSFDRTPAAQSLVRVFRLEPGVILQPTLGIEREPLQDIAAAIAGETRTGADGRFELAGVPPRSMYLLKADADGTNPTLHFAARTPGPAETVDLGDIVLKNGAIATGIVVDEDGTPVAGALVRAVDIPGMITQAVPVEQFDPQGWLIIHEGPAPMVVQFPPWVQRVFDELPIASSTTDADGRFRLTGIQPGINLVAATKTGRLPHVLSSVKLEGGQERDLGKLRLREGETAGGRVLDGAGKPVADAQVIVGSKLAIAPVVFARTVGTTDARGEFECPGFAAGEVLAAVRRGPHDAWFVTQPQPIQREFLVVLPARCTLTVRVLSEAGAAIAEPKFKLLAAPAGVEPAAGMSMFGLANRIALDTRQARLADGRFQIRDLDAGRYALVVAAAGHAWAATDVELAGDREVEVRLVPESGLSVRVTDQAGKPVRNATIYAQQRGNDLREFPVHCGFTGADGRLTVTRLVPGNAVIEAGHPRYGAVAARTTVPANEPVVLVLAEPGAIAGTVTAGGEPPAPGKFMVTAEMQWREDVVRGPTGEMPALAVLDAEGRFTLRGLQPGTWQVRVVDSANGLGAFSDLTRMFTFAAFQERPEETVEVVSGQTAQVALDLNKPRTVEGPSARITGTVFIDARPAEGAVVSGWQGRFMAATVDASGRFDLGQVPAGDFHLNVQDRSPDSGSPFESALYSRPITVKAGEDVELNITINTGSMAGLVLQPDGSPASSVQVRAWRTDGEGGHLRTSTDTQGRFRFARASVGKYSIEAFHRTAGRGTAEASVGPATSTDDVQVQLARVYSASGKIDRTLLPKPADPDQDWLYVQFQREPDGPRRDGPSSGDGARGEGDFKVEGLPPGRYRVHVYGNLQGDWRHPDVIEITDHDLTGLQIRPVKQEPKPAVEKTPVRR